MGGFECATHRRRDGVRLDVIAGSRHDLHCVEDYQLLAQSDVRSVRDGLRWHLIEAVPGFYDWSSLMPMLEAANQNGMQILWDLCHWGVPDWLDIFSAEFVERFAAFTAAAVRVIQQHRTRKTTTLPDIFCPVNEISFWSFIGGDREHFYPYAANRGSELKRQLVRASLAAIHAIREVDVDARFIQAEPIIHISADPLKPQDIVAAANYTAAQFEAWDMLDGLREPELGGAPDFLDLIGVNYYWNNQWIHEGPQTPLGHPLHRPLHRMLVDVWERYHRSIVITETGIEGAAAAGWLGYVAAEARQAQRLGVKLLGVCFYPVMDYPGWDDDRHCPCGLIEVVSDWSGRKLRPDLVEELQAQQALSEAQGGPTQSAPEATAGPHPGSRADTDDDRLPNGAEIRLI
jgi:hypothetical protein